MSQGGFSRDFQAATNLRNRAEQELMKKERDLIGKEVIQKLNPYFEQQLRDIKGDLGLEQEQITREFIEIMKSRNILLKYLLWTTFLSLITLSFTLGYFL